MVFLATVFFSFPSQNRRMRTHTKHLIECSTALLSLLQLYFSPSPPPPPPPPPSLLCFFLPVAVSCSIGLLSSRVINLYNYSSTPCYSRKERGGTARRERKRRHKKFRVEGSERARGRGKEETIKLLMANAIIES